MKSWLETSAMMPEHRSWKVENIRQEPSEASAFEQWFSFESLCILWLFEQRVRRIDQIVNVLA